MKTSEAFPNGLWLETQCTSFDENKPDRETCKPPGPKGPVPEEREGIHAQGCRVPSRRVLRADAEILRWASASLSCFWKDRAAAAGRIDLSHFSSCAGIVPTRAPEHEKGPNRGAKFTLEVNMVPLAGASLYRKFK